MDRQTQIVIDRLSPHRLRLFVRELFRDINNYVPDSVSQNRLKNLINVKDEKFEPEKRYLLHKKSLLETNTFVKDAYTAIITIAYEQSRDNIGVSTRELMLHMYNFYPEEMKVLAQEKLQQRDKIAIGYLLKDAGFVRVTKRPKKNDTRSIVSVWVPGPLIKGLDLTGILSRYENKDIPVSTDTFI